ncbi:probable RNA-directed DNA polymerase from transposon X-element [Trichonephila clavipes]|nr:probable RNA-directed DNA polymerase from transposon X-element [Trichonephila clavipes]
MENLSDDQSVIMEEIDPQNITDEQKCNNLKSIDKQIKIFTARKDYIRTMLNIEKSIPGPTNETTQKLEAEAAGLDDKIKALEEYNLILQDIHRTHPTATNTHIGGYIKIQAESADHHREITKFLTDKKVQYYVTDPPSTNRPLKLVIKGLLATTDPEDIKKDLIDQGIKIEKVAQLRQFKTKSPLPIFMLEITRDENVDDIFKIRSCLYMQIKFDPFRKNSRPTQCYNCNCFHHASQNCSMKTRCLKCGGGHRTGQCEIKEKIINPTCINCNAEGHMASSTECPLFPKPRKGKGQSQKENKKRNENIQENSALITPGLSFAQVTSGQNSQQRAARGSDSSTSNSDNKNKNKSFNSETLNHINCQGGDFSFLEAIFEMKKIFDLFPNLISEMKKSSKCTDPTDKLQCLLKAGDYNAKHTSWGCNYSDPRGNYLLRYITNNNLDLISPPTPTRFGTDSASTLDYALIKNLIWPCTADSIPELSSDHNPVKFHFPRTSNFAIPPPQLNTTWSIFTKILANSDNFFFPTANSTHEIDSQVSNLTDEILNAHASASRPFYHTEQPYVQGELKELFKERNKARKTWQHTRHPQHKIELNRLQNAIKRKIYHYRQQAWEDNLSTLNAEDNSLWGIAKAFRKKTSPISALNGPTGIALSDTNKTEVIAHSLEKQFHLNDIHNPRKDEIITNVVDAYMDSNINNTDIIPPTLPSEIIQIIKNIKIKKCPGRDGITNKMLKKLPRLTIFKITNIINNMLTLRYFPMSWKTAVVIPILKSGKNSALAESYRPISLLPVLSKLAEKVILARLNDHLERENILIPEQHGFRPRLSISHQLLRVVEFIKEGNNKDECTAAVFLDIQKAFDRVWHTGLLFKLITYKIPPPLIYLLNSYISDRSFTVKINRTFSQLKKINAGVAQGSILAPTLFNLYVNDITKNSNTIICMYADDTAILSRHRNLDTLVENINEHLAHLETWFSVWKIAFNSSKTEAVFFSKRKPPPEITQQNQRIPWSQHTKYLGVIVDKNLTFRQHIPYIRDKFKDTTRKLYSLICRKSKLSRPVFLKVWGAPPWGGAMTLQGGRERIENLKIFLKKITGKRSKTKCFLP